MKTEFLHPRFDGPRFSEHTLPLEVARDLAAYETLVVELAKHLYLKDHQDRQRAPKGFASDFHLHLERIDDGSTAPLLSTVSGGTPSLDLNYNPYFERSRRLIADCIAAFDGQLPEEFPRDLLIHFNQVGRSLREDEKMEIPIEGDRVATLTPARRKQLVLAAEKVYEREIELNGTIGEADWEKSSFRLRLSDNSFAIIPMTESFHAQAREYGGRNRCQVTVKGVGTFDSWDKLQKVLSVESLEIQPNYQLSARFDSLSMMEDGWLDGEGLAPDKTKLAEIAERMIAHYDEKLPLPAIAPTPEGNLLFEWEVPGSPSIDLDLASFRAEFHSFLPDEKETEREFLLLNEDVWNEFFSFLSEILAPYSS